MYPNNETQPQKPEYPQIATGQLAQVANTLQIIRSVVGTPRAQTSMNNSQKETAVFDGLRQGANPDAVLRSALVLAAEPKLLDKVRDTFGDQQSLQYSAKRNRTFYIDGDPEDIKAAVATFDKMFGRTIPPLPVPKQAIGVQPPAIGTSTGQLESKAPSSAPKRDVVPEQGSKLNTPTVMMQPAVGNVPPKMTGAPPFSGPKKLNAPIVPPRPPRTVGTNPTNALLAENTLTASLAAPGRVEGLKAKLDLTQIVKKHN
jgi:hypothetical protein